MEDTLRDSSVLTEDTGSNVLILVLMEDTLRDCDRFYVASSSVS